MKNNIKTNFDLKDPTNKTIKGLTVVAVILLVVCIVTIFIGLYLGFNKKEYDAKYWCEEYVKENIGDYTTNYYTIEEMEVFATENQEPEVVFHVYNIYGSYRVCWDSEFIVIITYKQGKSKNSLIKDDIVKIEVMSEHNGWYNNYS